MQGFPSLGVATGSYLADCQLFGHSVHGQADLSPGRPPTLSFLGDIEGIDTAESSYQLFPRELEVSRVVGQLSSNHDIVMVDNSVSTWFPGRNVVNGRYAIVGLGVAAVSDDRYKRIRLQVTGSDLLFGVAPVKQIFWPRSDAPAVEQRYSAVLDDASAHQWRNSHDGIAIECAYHLQFSLSNPFRYELAFAPVIEFTATHALTVDEWLKQWVTPLRSIASLATRGPQRLSWLTVHAGRKKADVSGVVFGSNIDQEPYQADFRQEWRVPERWPLFTLASLPVGLPVVLRRWRNLEEGQNPFVQLYRLALNQPDLPPRARFLYLIQALEALHGHENQDRDEQSQMDFAKRRRDVLNEATSLSFSPTSLSFLRKTWSSRRPDSLDRRLAALLAALPPAVRSRVETPDMADIGSALHADGADTVQAQLRMLRNQLSHGTRHYADRELRPWVSAVELVCRAHLLRLLGFSSTAIVSGLAPDK